MSQRAVGRDSVRRWGQSARPVGLLHSTAAAAPLSDSEMRHVTGERQRAASEGNEPPANRRLRLPEKTGKRLPRVGV